MEKRIYIDNKEIILVGTAHVSKESVLEVEEVIRREMPDIVAIELCQGRLDKMKNPSSMDKEDLMSALKNGKGLFLLFNLFLSSYQKKIGDAIGVTPGSEMLKAISVASELNISLQPIDRNIETTLKRVIRHLSLKEKLIGASSLLGSIFSDSEETIDEAMIEDLKEQEVISSSLEALSEVFPSVKEFLIDERDQFMGRKVQDLNCEKIVVVIGAGHLEGIEKVLKGTYGEVKEISELNSVPKKRKYFKYITIAIFLVLTVFFAFTIKLDPALALSNIYIWLLLTCSLSALGALLARGHILTVITSFFASPIGAVLPHVASGFFGGYVEGKIHKPAIKDFNELPSDIFKFKKWWKNKVLKIFLVFFFASFGSAIGNIVGLKLIIDGFFTSI